MDAKAADPADEPEKKGGLHLPAWVVEWGRKLLPWAMMGIIGTGFALYRDNINNMKDISRNTWRNDQQDARIARLEAQRDEDKAIITGLMDNQNEFHPEVIERLQYLRDLLEKERRRRQQ